MAATLLPWATRAASAQPLRRAIEPLYVESPAEARLLNPFSGGLLQPRIGLYDVTGSELPDILTLNPGAELRVYRNEGGWRLRRMLPTPYDNLPLRGWFRFADLNADGAAELLTGGERSEMMMFSNAGSDHAPVFPASPSPMRTAAGDTIRTQRETVPSLVDIDADGDLDLFSGNLDGSISFYENTGTPSAPVFVFRTDRYMGILVVSGRTAPPSDQTSSASRHGASVLDFADLDGDADLDLLFGDAFTRRLLLFENTGSGSAAAFSMQRLDTAFRGFGDDVESEGFNQPAAADLDGDGDLDVVVSSLSPSRIERPLMLFENAGAARAPAMRRRSVDLTSEVDVGAYAAATWINDAEYTGLLVGSITGDLTLFELTGESPTELTRTLSLPLPGVYQTVPAAGDIDGDGRAELAIGEAFGSIAFYRFSDGRLERFGDTFLLNRNASPQLVDTDADGDLDLLAGAENGRVYFFLNTGTPTLPRFERAPVPPPFAGLDVGSDAAPRLFDLDRDGDLDALIGGRTGGATERPDSLRIFVRTDSGWEADPRWTPITDARNPVPLVLARPEGLLLLVGDQAGGILAYADDGSWLAVPRQTLEHEPPLRAVLTRQRLTVLTAPAQQDRTLIVADLIGRIVATAVVPAGARQLSLTLAPSAPLIISLGGGSALVVHVWPN